MANLTQASLADLAVSIGTPPMEAKLVEDLPSEPGWQYEPKWDGFRCLAFKAGDQVDLRAKSGVVYHHFPNKEAVSEAVLQRTSAALATRILAKVSGSRDVPAMLTRGTEGYFEARAEAPVGRIILKDGPAVLGWARWREIDEEHFGRAIPQALALAHGARSDRAAIRRSPWAATPSALRNECCRTLSSENPQCPASKS